jgi:4-amino-4-deoxy-L-arabinose transferase-like glycosyltransferase
MRNRILLLIAFAAILVALHAPFVHLPFHWDELGQFVPAALDIYRDGAWITHSTDPNIHPPGVMALLALVWSVTGYSILASRLTMLLLAAWGVYLSFLLAVRLSRGAAGAPAFTAVAFLMAAPMFYTQSMMVLLDMPAMVLTVLALLYFFDQRYTACAAATVVLVLVKETAITTPMVFGAWLLFRDRRWKEALYFFAPAVALGLWLVYLRQVTGSWFGNAEFAQYNVTDSFTPLHILYAILRRVYTLFLADGHWIGAIALYFGHKALRSREWTIAFAVAIAQLADVTFLGGAVLDRYLVPVLPILYAAFAVAASTYTAQRRLLSNLALIGLLVVGWFLNPPFPFPLENNLAVVDFVELQHDAAQYLESNFLGRRVVSVWPFTAAIRNPDFGYVQARIPTLRTPGLRLAEFKTVTLGDRDVIVTYSRGQTPPSYILGHPTIRGWFAPFIDLQPEATSEELRTIGFQSQARWERKGQWIEIYSRDTALASLSH